MIAPGASYLGRKALALGIPVACSIALIRQAAATLFDIQIPTWVLICVSATSVPLYTALRLSLKQLYYRREAAKLGARLAPTSSRGRWPGNLDMR
jgi:hypothetical protein